MTAAHVALYLHFTSYQIRTEKTHENTNIIIYVFSEQFYFYFLTNITIFAGCIVHIIFR